MVLEVLFHWNLRINIFKKAMKTRRSNIALFMLYAMLVTACTAENTPTLKLASQSKTAVVGSASLNPTKEPTHTPTFTSTPVDYSAIIQDFAGKWIAYSVISLNKAHPTTKPSGMRLEITANKYGVDGLACEAPQYELNTIRLNEFLAGLQQPDMSFELNQEEFPLLLSGCTDVEPSSVALVNPRTLAARIGNDILYFERDSGVTRNGLTVFTDLVSESSISPNYGVHAQIPQLEQPGAKNFNQAARSIVKVELAGFKKNFNDWQLPTEMADRSSFMWIGYDVPLLTPDLISIRFAVDYYMAGAAHPNHYFRVLNFDLTADKEIKFSDLFKNPEEALKILSIASKISLSKPDFPMFEEGILPKMENFANWNLTETDLRLSFDPYQVAPYAAGPQEVVIPFRDIHDLVKLKSAAGKLIFRK